MMFHRVKTTGVATQHTVSVSKEGAQERSPSQPVSEAATVNDKGPHNPYDYNSASRPFVKSQIASGKTASYLQASVEDVDKQDTSAVEGVLQDYTAVKAVEKEAVDSNEISGEQRKPDTKHTSVTSDQYSKTLNTTKPVSLEKDTKPMPENSPFASQTSSYQSPDKQAEAKSPAASLYSADSRGSAASGGYASTYSSPYARQPAAPVTASETFAGSDRKLTIGRGITMSGEIESCDHLHVEGTVEAALKGAQNLDIAESGIFYGTVEIENAVVAGRFEGELNVKGRLVVEATGTITGSITYGELQVESGAIIDGRMTPMSSAATSSNAQSSQTSQVSEKTMQQPSEAKSQAQAAQAEPSSTTRQTKGLFEKQSAVPAE